MIWRFFPFSTVQFSSVSQAGPTLCDPMDCSMLGFTVHCQLPEFTQTHVHWVGGLAISMSRKRLEFGLFQQVINLFTGLQWSSSHFPHLCGRHFPHLFYCCFFLFPSAGLVTHGPNLAQPQHPKSLGPITFSAFTLALPWVRPAFCVSSTYKIHI